MSLNTFPAFNPYPAVFSQSPLSAYSSPNTVSQNPQSGLVIQKALEYLGQLRNLPGDEIMLYNLGINPVFHNGAEALKLIHDHQISVVFGDMGDSLAHAQWIAEKNTIMINQKYEGGTSPDTIRAVAEAIYHEAGHAKDNDGFSSIQEEADCLALNTMAHRFHEVQDPNYALSTSKSRLMADGVALYPKLFFDSDPAKQRLVNRVTEKYGDLPLTSPNHEIPTNTFNPLPPIAQRVATHIQDQSPIISNQSPSAPLVGQQLNLTA